MTPERRAEIDEIAANPNWHLPATVEAALVEALAEIDRLQGRIDSVSPLIYAAAMQSLAGNPYHDEQIQWREMYTKLTGKTLDWQRQLQRHHGFIPNGATRTD